MIIVLLNVVIVLSLGKCIPHFVVAKNENLILFTVRLEDRTLLVCFYISHIYDFMSLHKGLLCAHNIISFYVT